MSELPPNGAGEVSTWVTTYFHRPDGHPTWTSTATGSVIPQPWFHYLGTAYPLFRRGVNLCLECSGGWAWDDVFPPGYVTVDIRPSCPSCAHTAQVWIPITAGVDPDHSGSYSLGYGGPIARRYP